jgi:hypothetical protein
MSSPPKEHRGDAPYQGFDDFEDPRIDWTHYYEHNFTTVLDATLYIKKLTSK